ncbi:MULTISPECIES: sensor histidine kinase [unclassified Shinella]|jgi:two-component system sensor histidine kinase TctE|uniref:sensor histidine kinase n=1 Tax=unclassified Shinella TaxID=2643062 RepID=UPI00234E5484|nr:MULTISPECIES: sensor histidine kinase [unclassified Shinella]MCO5154140.1 sensor histidine kinase [Shinella sp.]MDC7260941.1 sensor histidine kinase [Shinella sp. HY16]MDC7267836.1 sensor histidine kinase [Shinella sp. YZ44]
MKTETSLFSRLLLRVALVLFLGAAGIVTAAWFYAAAAADEAFDRLLQGAAFQIAENMVVEDGALEINMPSSAFELLGLATRDRIFYRVVGTDGKTLTGYEDLQPPIDLAESRRAPVFVSTRYGNTDVRMTIGARAVSDPALSGWVYIILAQTTEARTALASELTARAVILVAVMACATLFATALALRLSLRPVVDLSRVLHDREPQDLTPLAVEVPRELSPFVGSINYFMRRLDERMRLLHRFIGDSAHQIRTPLTALLAQLSLVDEKGLSNEGRHHLARVRARVEELSHLTNQLLGHAMVIHRFDSEKLVPIDIRDVARRAFKRAVPLSLDPDIVAAFEAPDAPVIVLGDALSLREAMVNVIDNALRHGAVAKLDVRVSVTGETALFAVEDDGPGIPPERWPEVITRFASSRSERHVSGLGFAIAAEVANLLGGHLRFLAAADGRGFTTIIELPLHQEDRT